MKRLLSVAFVLAATAAAGAASTSPGNGPAWTHGWPALAAASTTPHPAVVRVIAPDRGSLSLGSGTLVAVNQAHGLVITNWHVVADAAGPITVVFPDGTRSTAQLLGTDRDWDLAALAVVRPNVAPVRLAAEAPRPGEPLVIAGYGSGSYRAVTGSCTQYVAPGFNKPYEMVELAAGARQGDSGGPILNSRGELAGVLFGTARGRTTGSYCGRVRAFLAPLAGDFPQFLPAGRMLAEQSPAPGQALANPDAAAAPRAETAVPYAAIGAGPAATVSEIASLPPPVAAVPAADPTANYRMDQIKNVLAAVGALAILFHGLRLVSVLQG